MNERFEQIIQQARDIFMRYGLRSVTMDDICRELGISKKTLYQFVSDKNDLIHKILSQDIRNDEQRMCEWQVVNLSAIEELLAIQKMVGEKFKNMHSSILYDLKKYYPESWNLVIQHRTGFIIKSVEENILRGREQGLYRTDFNEKVISRMYATRMEAIFDPHVFEGLNLNPAEIYFESMAYHIRAIATPEGVRQFEHALTTHIPS